MERAETGSPGTSSVTFIRPSTLTGNTRFATGVYTRAHTSMHITLIHTSHAPTHTHAHILTAVSSMLCSQRTLEKRFRLGRQKSPRYFGIRTRPAVDTVGYTVLHACSSPLPDM